MWTTLATQFRALLSSLSELQFRPEAFTRTFSESPIDNMRREIMQLEFMAACSAHIKSKGHTMFSVFIPGDPATQGSKRHVGGGVLIDSCKRLPIWRSDVRNGCLTDDGQPKARVEGPIFLSLEFALKRPKSLPKTKIVHHTKRPDLSKLTRAVEDAITSAGIWADDSYVCRSYVTKRYAEPGEQTGCHIKVMPVESHGGGHAKTVH